MLNHIKELAKRSPTIVGLYYRIVRLYDSMRARGWFGKGRKYERISFPWVLDRIPQSGKILDVGGVGVGSIQSLTKDLLRRGHLVTEVDVNTTTFKHPNFTFIKEDILSLDFPSSTFDIVLAMYVLPHIGRKWRKLSKILDNQGDYKFANKIHKWLKPGGIAFVETNIASESQELVWDEDNIWRVYNFKLLKEIFAGFEVIDQLIYVEPLGTRQRVKDAKAIVLMLRRLNLENQTARDASWDVMNERWLKDEKD